MEGDLLRVCKLLSRAFISNIIDFDTKINISVLYKKFREPEVVCAHMNGQWHWYQRQQLLGRQDWKVEPRNDIKILCLGKITSLLSSRLPFAPLLFMWAHRTLVSRKFFYSIRNTKNQLKCYFIWWIWTSEGLHTLRRAYLSYPENFTLIWCVQVYFLELDRFLVMTGSLPFERDWVPNLQISFTCIKMPVALGLPKTHITLCWGIIISHNWRTHWLPTYSQRNFLPNR